MHVLGINLDLNTLLQILFTVLVLAFGLLHLVKNTASKYFEVHANFNHSETTRTAGIASAGCADVPAMPLDNSCFVCGKDGSKQCSRCKSVRYCSQDCQSRDWSSGHKDKCKKSKLSGKLSSSFLNGGVKACAGGSSSANGGSEVAIQTKKVLYPYDEFIELFNWKMPGFPPCGLLNSGNTCYANVVLQCLSFTRPLIAYLLEKSHRRECRRNDFCFLCEFQIHVERASRTLRPFSPFNILSRLPNIGGNLGYGRQEDAHEFMRFAIDTMQSVCLNEFGGERAVHPWSQETTLIQHIFGGQLRSQVICTECEKVSNQYENMMDLTVEIHGDASSLEECLNQFTAKEWLHGENMYKCDGCNDYVKAWKRLTVQTPPNILTIALKRFQSGRFGKLNKKVTFPETLDLSPYMSEEGDGTDVYKLYAVVVHVDMLNAAYYGHYICFAKNFLGTWYEIDDCKVVPVSLEAVLSEGAYMLLYSRVSARPSCLKAAEHLEDAQSEKEKVQVERRPRKQIDSFAPEPSLNSEPLSSDSISNVSLSCCEKELSIADNSGSTGELGHKDMSTSSSNSSLSPESSGNENGSSLVSSSEVPAGMNEDNPMSSSPILKEIPRKEEESYIMNTALDSNGAKQITVVDPVSPALQSGTLRSEEAVGENPEDADLVKSKSSTAAVKNLKVYGNGHATLECAGFPDKEAQEIFSNSFHSSDETSAKVNNMKQEQLRKHNIEDGNGVKSN